MDQLILVQFYCYRAGGCPLKEVKLYCHGPVGTTELVLYIERLNPSGIVSFIQSVL